jgi:hypothetical protein
MQKLESKVRRVFADEMLYVFVRPTGIIEIRKKTLNIMENDLIIKRWQKWTPIDRILYELWERDTWSRDGGKYQLLDDEKAARSMKTISKAKEQERLKRMANKQDGKRL